jgi:predicted alpha/beta-fold hydrolase
VPTPQTPASPLFHPTAFHPAWWLPTGHLQTVIGNFLPRTYTLPPATAELVEVSPATYSQISSQVLCHCHWQPEPVRRDRLTVLLVHGLEGSSTSQYILGNAQRMWHAGFNVIRMNMRNCGGTESLTPTLYHSGLSSDVGKVFDFCARKFSLTRIALVGYSMGGNLVLKLAGEMGASQPLLTAVVSVSGALDLGPSADALHEPANRMYERRFRNALLRRFRRKAMLYPRVYDPAQADGVRTLRDFDERITALYSGFRSAADYYERASAARVLPTIAAPTLVLHALDDPFIRITPQSEAALRANPAITYLETDHGGHCAFIESRNRALHYDGYWAEKTLLDFLLST